MDELIDLLKKQQKRYSKKEKKEFAEFLKEQLTSNGFDVEILKSKLFQTEHVASKSVNNPAVIFLAHYDTSTTLPIWVEWLLRVFGHTRNILTLLLLFLIFNLISTIGNDSIEIIIKALIAGSIFVPMILIPNKNTMNDNTSGVLVILLLAKRISNSEVLKNKVKFVFTDNEEKSLIGSFQLKKIWKKMNFNYGNRIISVDSVGTGDHLIISYNIVNTLSKELKSFFSERIQSVKTVNMYNMPFSDAFSFSKNGAVNINMMKKSIIPGGYYIPNIHSKRDNNINTENIYKIVDTLEDYIKNVC